MYAMDHDSTPQPWYDDLGVMVMPTSPGIDPRQILTLRMLGRLRYMHTAQIREMLYPRTNPQTVRRHLADMEKRRLIWCRTIPHATMPRKPNQRGRRQLPIRLPYMYGLTPEGKHVLAALDAEPDEYSLNALAVSKTPQDDRLTIGHDLYVSWWVGRLFYELRCNPYVVAVFIESEMTTVAKRQRADCVIIIRFSTTPHTIDQRDMLSWPFFTGDPRQADEIDVRLALEVDRGTEEPKVIFNKAHTYGSLHAAGTYHTLFSGPIVPVFTVPDEYRRRRIAREWRDGWPGGWGFIALERSVISDGSIICGDYRSLYADERVNLTTRMGIEPGGQLYRPMPVFTEEQWRATTVIPRIERSRRGWDFAIDAEDAEGNDDKR